MLRRRQHGYLLEVPVILAALVIGVVILVPQLSMLPAKIVVGVAAIGVVACLWYMLLVPGWQPEARTVSRVRAVLSFAVAAGATLAAAIAWIAGWRP